MRKLAHIERIIDIQPIEGADMIEKCTVLGWQCVIAKKDNFKVDDLIVYIEIDSIVPPKPQFEFLKERKYRIRTIKLKKTISQGLVLPLSVLPSKNYKEGDDVTDILEITKYDPEAETERKALERNLKIEKSKLKRYLKRFAWYRKLFMSRTQKQCFPYFLQKTDEERIQNFPHVLEQFKDKTFYVTEKVDYQSVTFFTKTVPYLWFFKKKIFGVCSRNLQVFDKNTLYWKIAIKYDLERKMRAYDSDLIIQGEQGDVNVQDNKYSITEPKLWVFNVIWGGRQLDFTEMWVFCNENNLTTVPLLNPAYKLPSTVQELVEYSKGKSTLADIPREGIVVRCIENGQKLLSFKVINPEFLLKFNL